MVLPESVKDFVYKDNFKKIEEFVQNGGDINARDEFEDTLINSASYYGNWTLVKKLVALGADINSRDYGGRSVMWHVSSSNNPILVEEMINLGADIYIKGIYGTDYFSNCIGTSERKGSVDVVKVLIKHGVDINTPNSRRKKWDPVLITAVSNKHYEMVRVLLEAGVDSKCAGNRSSMSCAIANGDSEMVDVLLDCGFNLKFRKNDFITGKTAAGRFYHPIVEAAKVNDVISAEKLLKAGVKPDHYHDWPCYTALHVAARNGYLDMVKLLVKHGAKLTYDRSEKSQFKEFELPLAGAILGDKLDVIQFLIENGADPAELIQKGESSFTGISLAASHKKTEVLTFFRKHCGDEIVDSHIARGDIPMVSSS